MTNNNIANYDRDAFIKMTVEVIPQRGHNTYAVSIPMGDRKNWYHTLDYSEKGALWDKVHNASV